MTESKRPSLKAPTKANLRVYHAKEDPNRWWSPDHEGLLDTPKGWNFLSSGDAFVTGQVKAMGPYWVILKRRKGYTATVGLLAPSANIKNALALADQTGKDREAKRAAARKTRARKETNYKQDLELAIIEYLDFTPEHATLAANIALEAASRAAVVGSGRVGRTKLLPFKDRARLAARAHIRHCFTTYERRLERAMMGKGYDDEDLEKGDDKVLTRTEADAVGANFGFGLDKEVHNEIKRIAENEVSDFLSAHRRTHDDCES